VKNVEIPINRVNKYILATLDDAYPKESFILEEIVVYPIFDIIWNSIAINISIKIRQNFSFHLIQQYKDNL
jgi:hypothetical protein